jgi:predicted GIY-YIG superfamily endonuclease
MKAQHTFPILFNHFLIEKEKPILYILKLVKEKYYVGKTTNLVSRMKQHMNGKGAVFTKLYPPIELVYSKRVENIFDEDLLTKEMMMKFGIENVRGGSYSQINIDQCKQSVLETEFMTALDLCYHCGNKLHFGSSCSK